MQVKANSPAAICAAVVLTFAACAAGVSAAEDRKVPDTYTAVTTNMTPADVELKADILTWSDADSRAAAMEALSAEDPGAALAKLPTLGVVWRSGSAVGHAIKFAERTTAGDGSEKITLVTDKPIGFTSFEPWKAKDAAPALDYSVLELDVPASGTGSGTMSLAAEVRVDKASGTLSLDAGARAPLLTHVAKKPKPYWASAN